MSRSQNIYRIARNNISNDQVLANTCARLFPCGWTLVACLSDNLVEVASTHTAPASEMRNVSAWNTGRTITVRELVTLAA